MAHPVPKPTRLRMLEGNPSKRPLNMNEPQPPTTALALECPEHLGDIARDEWDLIAPILHRMGLLTDVDRDALAAYCTAYERWMECKKELKSGLVMVTPSGYQQQKPQVSMEQQYLKILKDFMHEFGLTPASRSKLIAPNAPKDDLDALLR